MKDKAYVLVESEFSAEFLQKMYENSLDNCFVAEITASMYMPFHDGSFNFTHKKHSFGNYYKESHEITIFTSFQKFEEACNLAAAKLKLKK